MKRAFRSILFVLILAEAPLVRAQDSRPIEPPRTLEDDDTLWGIGLSGTLRTEVNIGRNKKSLSTRDSIVTFTLPVPGSEGLEILLSAEMNTLTQSQNGKTKFEINSESLLRQFALRYQLAELNGRPVIIALGKTSIPVGIEVRKTGDALQNPLVKNGLTRKSELFGFIVELPVKLWGPFDQIKASLYHNKEFDWSASSLVPNSIAVQLTTYVTQEIKAVVAVDSQKLKNTTANVGLLYKDEEGNLTAWVQGTYFQHNEFTPRSHWAVQAGLAYDFGWIEMVGEITYFQEGKKSLATGLNLPITDHTRLSYTLRHTDGEGLLHTIALEYVLGKKHIQDAHDPLAEDYE